MASEKPILGYWKIRGLTAVPTAQQIRLLLVYCGVDFEDAFYEQGDGPEFSRESWRSVKETLGLAFPNLPYFIDGPVSLTQSLAIMRYVAGKWAPDLLGPAPSTPAGAEMGMVLGVLEDLKGALTGPCYSGAMDRAALEQLALDRSAPLAKFMEGRKWVAGETLTYVDFVLFELLELQDFITDGKIFKTFPVLKAYHDRVHALPRVKEYYDSDRCMKRPFNNKVAKINN